MELKSKICTSIEQSKKLLELGLKPETADMHYHKNKLIKWRLETYPLRTKEDSAVYKGLVRVDGQQYADEYFERVYGQDIPAWSLSRLIELMPREIRDDHRILCKLVIQKSGNIFIYMNDDNFSPCLYILIDFRGQSLFDSAINMMEWLIKKNYFNKEYLCNK